MTTPSKCAAPCRVGILMPGEEKPPSTRFSMQVWRDGRWVVAALENARLLSLQTMSALESLTDV